MSQKVKVKIEPDLSPLIAAVAQAAEVFRKLAAALDVAVEELRATAKEARGA